MTETELQQVEALYRGSVWKVVPPRAQWPAQWVPKLVACCRQQAAEILRWKGLHDELAAEKAELERQIQVVIPNLAGAAMTLDKKVDRLGTLLRKLKGK